MQGTLHEIIEVATKVIKATQTFRLTERYAYHHRKENLCKFMKMHAQ